MTIYMLALVFISLSIALVIYGLARQYVGHAYYPQSPDIDRLARRSATEATVATDRHLPAPAPFAEAAVEELGEEAELTEEAEPTLVDFDPESEVVVVQLPESELQDSRREDFVSRADPGGKGQMILFRDRVLLHLPDVPVGRRIDLYVEAAG